MKAERWRFVKERPEPGAIAAHLFASEDKPGRFRRVLVLSRAATAKTGGAWCVVEFCERGPDGELSPWKEAAWKWPADAYPPPGAKLGTGPAM